MRRVVTRMLSSIRALNGEGLLGVVNGVPWQGL